MTDASRSGDRRDRRLPIVLVVAIALLTAAFVDRVDAGESRAAVAESAGPSIPSADAVSSAWYCAAGSSTPGAPGDETIVIANLGARSTGATVTVMPGAGQPPVVRGVTLAPRAQTRVRVSDLVAAATPGVIVETSGGPAVVEHELRGNDDLAVGPCATRSSNEWHFASGTTDKGAALGLSLFNPFGDDAIVDLAFLTDSGFQAPGDLQGLVVPRRSRVDVPVHDSVRRQALVATQVRARTGRVVAEQSLLLDGTTGGRGLAVSLGVPAPVSSAVVPLGAGVNGTNVGIALANPGTSAAHVTVDTRLDGAATLAPQTVVVPSRSVVVTDPGARVPAGLGAWARLDVHGSQVVAEQSLTRAGSAGIAISSGVTVPARRWALAAARAAAGVGDALGIVDPGRTGARVTLHALAGGRDQVVAGARERRIDPGRRLVLDLAALAVPPDAALLVVATIPVSVVRVGEGDAGLTESPAIPGGAG